MYPITVDTWNSCHMYYKVVPVINIVATGKNIDKLRKESNLSIRELAEILGFTTPQAVYKWVHGKNLPTLDNMVILAHVFRVTIDKIIVTEEKVIAIEQKGNNIMSTFVYISTVIMPPIVLMGCIAIIVHEIISLLKGDD